jgi:hypothetical protein
MPLAPAAGQRQHRGMTSTRVTHRPGPPIWPERRGHTVVLAADLGGLSELRGRRLRVLDRILAGWHGFSLDGRLAAGASPEGDRLLAARASALVDLRRRQKLAGDWGRLARMALARPAPAARMPLRRDRIVAAGPEILRLQDSLRAALPVPVRGVAMASRLLCDAAGPVYSRRSPVDLRAALQEAIQQMDPGTVLLPDRRDRPDRPDRHAGS